MNLRVNGGQAQKEIEEGKGRNDVSTMLMYENRKT